MDPEKGKKYRARKELVVERGQGVSPYTLKKGSTFSIDSSRNTRVNGVDVRCCALVSGTLTVKETGEERSNPNPQQQWCFHLPLKYVTDEYILSDFSR